MALNKKGILVIPFFIWWHWLAAHYRPRSQRLQHGKRFLTFTATEVKNLSQLQREKGVTIFRRTLRNSQKHDCHRRSLFATVSLISPRKIPIQLVHAAATLVQKNIPLPRFGCRAQNRLRIGTSIVFTRP